MPVNSKQDYYFLETPDAKGRQICPRVSPAASGAAGGYFSPAPGSSSVAPSESAMKP
jgi:hypothetical protein